MLNRVHARWIGFVFVVVACVWFELSPLGRAATDFVIDLQLATLSHWSPISDGGHAALAGVDTEAAAHGGGVRPLSRTMMMTLVVIGALTWWESRLVGWAIASSLAAPVALIAVSTMMLPRGVAVPTAGPGLAIVAGMLGRRALEAIIAFRDRGRQTDGPPTAKFQSGK